MALAAGAAGAASYLVNVRTKEETGIEGGRKYRKGLLSAEPASSSKEEERERERGEGHSIFPLRLFSDMTIIAHSQRERAHAWAGGEGRGTPEWPDLGARAREGQKGNNIPRVQN